jgi:putative NADH-flavin reductase
MGMLVGIAGITGRYGHLLANEILKVSDASIRGFCRNPAKINQSLLSSSRFEIAKGGAFDRDEVVKFVKTRRG